MKQMSWYLSEWLLTLHCSKLSGLFVLLQSQFWGNNSFVRFNRSQSSKLILCSASFTPCEQLGLVWIYLNLWLPVSEMHNFLDCRLKLEVYDGPLKHYSGINLQRKVRGWGKNESKATEVERDVNAQAEGVVREELGLWRAIHAECEYLSLGLQTV